MLSGNTSEAGDGRGSPDKSFLFLLTSVTDPGIGLPGDGVSGLGKAFAFWTFRCALDAP